MKSRFALALCAMAIFAAAVVPCDAARFFNMVGVWSGTGKGANGTEFTTSTIMLTVTDQQNRLFNGTMSFNDGTPFAISGAVTDNSVRITASEGIFEASVLRFGRTLFLSGSGSKLEVQVPGTSTVVFSLRKEL